MTAESCFTCIQIDLFGHGCGEFLLREGTSSSESSDRAKVFAYNLVLTECALSNIVFASRVS
jgi:hypothetical protein